MSKTENDNDTIKRDQEVEASKLLEATELRMEKAFIDDGDADVDADVENLLADDSEDTENSTPDDGSAEDSEKKDDSTPDKDSVSKDEDKSENKDEDKDGKEDRATEEDADKDSTQDKVSGLSDAYYRAAIHRGWSEDDIKDFYEANPKLATTTLGKIYEAVNRSSKEFAAFGRAHKERVINVQTDPSTASETGKGKAGEESFTVDMDKLRNEYSDDPIVGVVEELVKKINTMGKSAPASVPADVPTAAPSTNNNEVAAIEQQIEGFFASSEVKAYEDFYGKLPANSEDYNSLTPGEKANRWAVISMMDEMLAGAEALGREMSVSEAMRLSHLVTTEPIREKVIREELKSQTVKRSKSITLKPSSTNSQEKTTPQTDKELEASVEEKLNKVFN